jgi:hypothetical protein
MRTDRSTAIALPRFALALVAAAVLAWPAAALAQQTTPAVEVLLPPGPAAAGGERAPALIVLTPAPPPVRGWEEPERMEVEVVGAGASQVVVYTPPPEPMPGWEKLQGVDIRTHRFAEAPEPSRIQTLAWRPGARTEIVSHDWRSTDRRGVPSAGTGRALATQSWNPSGERYAAPRLRYDEWWMRHAGGAD